MAPKKKLSIKADEAAKKEAEMKAAEEAAAAAAAVLSFSVPEVNPLQEQLDEQADEIIKLREVLAIIGSGEGDLRESKILDLFKKNRLLNMQLERERTRNNKTRQAFAVLQQELLNRAQPRGEDESSIKAGLDYWVDKYHRTNRRLLEVQANQTILESKISKLHHIIQREVGEHIPLQKVLEEGSGWVGRSEQVSLLRDKVAELKVQVEELQPSDPGYNTVFNDEHRTVEILHRNQLEAMDKDRRLQYDKMVHDFLALRTSWGMQKQRLDAVIARKNNVEKEIRGARQKMGLLLGKSTNDDLLIQALTIELAAARQAMGPPHPKPGGPLQLDHHVRCNRLVASYHELKEQCHEQAHSSLFFSISLQCWSNDSKVQDYIPIQKFNAQVVAMQEMKSCGHRLRCWLHMLPPTILFKSRSITTRF